MQNSYVIGKPVSKILALAEHYHKDSQQIQVQQHSLVSKPQVQDKSSREHDDPKELSSPSSSDRSKMCLEDVSEPPPVKDLPKMEKSSSLSSHENAAAAGMRIAKTEKKDNSIERLLASNNFGSCYRVHSLEYKGSPISSDGSNNGGSNNSSISSKDLPFNPTLCIMSICPILKSSNASTLKHAGSSKSPKRRKHGHHSHGHRHHQSNSSTNTLSSRRMNHPTTKNATPSHYVLQLFLSNEGKDLTENNSNASGKVPSNVGIDMSSNDADRGEVASANTSHSSTSAKAVIACG